MRSVFAASLVLVAACSGASTAGSAPPPTVNSAPPTQRIITASGTGGMSVNTGANLDNNIRLLSTGTVAQVWSVLPAVYEELAIPLTTKDDAQKMLGNSGWRTRRAIGRVPMQRYLDCGRAGNMENAETYQISMSIMTTVSANPNGGSVVGTIISATGRNPLTSSTQEVRCASLSELEIRIRDMVQQKVAAMTTP